jgi:hypothetical protein
MAAHQVDSNFCNRLNIRLIQHKRWISGSARRKKPNRFHVVEFIEWRQMSRIRRSQRWHNEGLFTIKVQQRAAVTK